MAVALPASIGVGKTGTAEVRVISGAGVPLPNLTLTLSATGAAAPSTVKTNANGVATVTLRATSAEGVHLKATTEPAAGHPPDCLHADHRQAAPNGQRVAAADAQQVTGDDNRPDRKRRSP